MLSTEWYKPAASFPMWDSWDWQTLARAAHAELVASRSLLFLESQVFSLRLLNLAFVGILCSGLHAIFHPGSVEAGVLSVLSVLDGLHDEGSASPLLLASSVICL